MQTLGLLHKQTTSSIPISYIVAQCLQGPDYPFSHFTWYIGLIDSNSADAICTSSAVEIYYHESKRKGGGCHSMSERPRYTLQPVGVATAVPVTHDSSSLPCYWRTWLEATNADVEVGQ